MRPQTNQHLTRTNKKRRHDAGPYEIVIFGQPRAELLRSHRLSTGKLLRLLANLLKQPLTHNNHLAIGLSG